MAFVLPRAIFHSTRSKVPIAWRSLANDGKSVVALRRCATKPSPAAEPPKSDPKSPGLTYHRPNNFEKFLLVWHKRFPSKEEVPEFVPQNMMERVRNLTRIKLNIAMCALAMLGCIVMIMSGKKAAKRGESVTQMNLEWHKQLKETKEK